MATGTGLDSQLGVATETTWGTGVTVTRFLEWDGEGPLKFDPTTLEPTGLRVGTKYKRVSRVRRSRKSASGDFTLQLATLGIGRLIKHMLGSTVTTTTQVAATTAYRQIHTPGDHRGLSMTIQVGRPEPSTGTVRPHSYPGCKVVSWEFSLEDNAIPTLKLTIDGRDEDTTTALATASFLAGSSVFDFSQATLRLGGTPTTAAGETTIAGGTAIATVVRSITVAGENPMAVERFGLGNAGLKSEPLENDTPTIMGTLGAEFHKAEIYDLFKNNTTTALQLDLTGAVIEGANNYLFSIILPAVKLKTAEPTVGGPDIVQMDTEFEAYSDETNPVIQIKIVSTEATVI